MIIRDGMAPFELVQPTRLDGALSLLDRHGVDAWKLAGGNDSLGWFKDRIKRPKVVVDLGGIDGLAGVRETADGVEIGAMTTLAALERHPLIVARYRLLAAAAAQVATPQIRNTGTIGGNIAQHARCWYYRSGQPCYRAGGRECFADSPDSINREHALFGVGACAAVSPSDLAPALVALDARLVIRSSRGERVVGTDTFFVGPNVDRTSLTCLGPDELLVAVRLPAVWADRHFYFEKVADRRSWDFALVSVAAAIDVDGGTIVGARIACGAVSAVPRLLPAVSEAIRGRERDQETAALAGEAAVIGAKPLTYNGFKLPLLANLVTRAVREAKT